MSSSKRIELPIRRIAPDPTTDSGGFDTVDHEPDRCTTRARWDQTMRSFKALHEVIWFLEQGGAPLDRDAIERLASLAGDLEQDIDIDWTYLEP